jgi:hypothetical protein
MRIPILLILAILISGCASMYEQNVLTQPTARLVTGKSVVIATPANGFYESTEYRASGRATALAIRAAFARFSNMITVVPECSDLVCLKGIQTSRFDYYVIPEILHWEDRATEWSGKPDRITIKVSIHEGQNWKELASTIISGTSKWATLGGDHPQDLLPEPLNKYIESLF